MMNIPVKTLRYYDEIGLFKPNEVNALNGYQKWRANPPEVRRNFLGFY